MRGRRDLALLCVAAVLSATGTTMLGLLTPLVALRLGAGPALVGALVSSGFVLPLLLAVPAGTWVDRWGARRMARAGYAAFALAAVPMVALPSWPSLIFAYVLANLAHLLHTVGSQSLVADLAEPGPAREAAYGWWTTSVAVGQAVGPLIGGLALDLLGVRAGFGAMAAVLAIAYAATLPMRVVGRTETTVPRVRWEGARRILGDRVVGLAMLTSSAAMWAVTVQATFVPVHLEWSGVPASAIGALFSVRSVVAVLIRPWMPRVVAVLGGRERTVALTLLAMAIGLAGFAFSDPWWLLVLLMVLFGTGFGLSQPVSMVMVADRVDARERGTAMGVRLTGNRLAQLLAPLALAVVAERAGLPVFFVLHGALVLLAAVLLVRLARREPGPSMGTTPQSDRRMQTSRFASIMRGLGSGGRRSRGPRPRTR